MRIGIAVDEGLGPVTLDEMTGKVRAAADAGFATAWWAQLFNWDALTTMAVVGSRVPGIALGTAVVPTYPRHPLMLAGQALTVQAAIGNRLRLGIGPSHRFLMEDRYGYSFERPARHVREYLSALLPLLRGEGVSYQGETLRAIGEIQVPGSEPPSVLLAALGPALLKIAGELTDGTITAWTGPSTIASHIVPTIARAAQAAGRPDPQVVSSGLVMLTSDPEGARRIVHERFGMVGQAPSYRAMLEREQVASPADLAIVGDAEAIERGLQRYADAGVTEFLAYPIGSDEECSRTIDLLAELSRRRGRDDSQ
jgi:F420-dependent oxidoreductase-like protein